MDWLERVTGMSPHDLLVLVIQVAVAVFFYGRLSQKTDAHETRISNLESDSKDHSKAIAKLESTAERRRT
jgi:hypothetical protein